MEQDDELMAVLMVVVHATIQHHGHCNVHECVQTAKDILKEAEIKKKNE